MNNQYKIDRTGEKVIADFERLLKTGDMSKLTPGLYYELTMHGGFIAHFSIDGFRNHFENRLSMLIEGELYPLNDRFHWSLRSDCLGDSIYIDGLTSGDVMRGICEVAERLAEDVFAYENNKRRDYNISVAQSVVDRYGVNLAPSTKRKVGK